MRTYPIRCEEAAKIIGKAQDCCSSCHEDEDEGYSWLCGGGMEEHEGREWEVCCSMMIFVQEWLQYKMEEK